MAREVFSPNDTFPILEITNPDCFHVAVEHFIKKSLESTAASPKTKESHRFPHLNFHPLLIENGFARYQPATDFGQTSFPTSLINIGSIPEPLRERLLFALGDSIDCLQVEVERSHQQTGGKSSSITLTSSTGSRSVSDSITARVDAQELRFSTKINGQVVYLDQNNPERRLTLSSELANFAYERLCVYLRSVQTQ